MLGKQKLANPHILPGPSKKSPDEVGGIGAAVNSTYCSSRGVKLSGSSQSTVTSAPEDLVSVAKTHSRAHACPPTQLQTKLKSNLHHCAES